jgi:hypothetical protein
LPDHEIERTAALIGRAQASATTLDSATEALARLKIGQDRSKIVVIVFYVYSGVIGATMLYLLYRAFFCKERVFDNFAEIMKIAVIPIVTLVIGYYFGSEKAAQS